MISSPVKMISQKFPFGEMSNSTTRWRQNVFLHFKKKKTASTDFQNQIKQKELKEVHFLKI